MKEENAIYVRLDPVEITYLNKILEAYDGLGILSTLDGKTGDAIIRVTPETRNDVLEILRTLPKDVEILAY